MGSLNQFLNGRLMALGCPHYMAIQAAKSSLCNRRVPQPTANSRPHRLLKSKKELQFKIPKVESTPKIKVILPIVKMVLCGSLMEIPIGRKFPSRFC